MRPAKDSPFPRLARRLALAALLVAAVVPGARAQQPNLPPARANFPVVLTDAGTTVASQPAIGDLDLDSGRKSIVFATVNRKLYVVLANGQVAPGFPKTLPARADSSPAIGDLDGDDVADIVIGFGSIATPTRSGGIRAFRSNGRVLWKRRSKDVFPADGVRDPVSTPAIGDIDGDGSAEVAYASVDGNVYVVRGADGALVPNWPRFVRDSALSSPALHDLDGDGKLEVIVGADAHLEGPPFDTPSGGCLHVFRYDGSELNGFPRCVDQVIVSAPAVGDIDGDGKPDIVVGTGTFWTTPERTHAVYAFAADGSDLPGWPVAVDGQVSTSPALADLDGDDGLEVVVTSDKTGPSQTFHLDAFHGDGTPVFPSVVPKSFFGTTSSAGTPVIADVLGDGAPEILFPTNTEACVVSSTGEQLTDDGTHDGALSFYTKTSLAGVLVGDLEDDGILDVIAVSAAPFATAADTVIHVWNPKGTATDAPPWGMFRGGADRTGVAPGTPVGEGSRYLPLDVYVRRLFVDFLGREPGPGEAQPWIDAIESQAKTRAEVGLEFLQTEAYQAGRATITRYYLGLLNRRPGWAKLESWSADLVSAGCVGLVCDETRRQEIVDAFAQMPLFEARFPSSLTTEEYVVALYAKVLGRTASQSAVDDWVTNIDQNGMTRAEVARHFVDSDEYVFDRSPQSVLVLLGYEGFLHKPPKKRVLEDWLIDLGLLRPPTDLVQFLITSNAYLARPEP